MTPSLEIHRVHLRVRNLPLSRDFYAGRLGFLITHETPAHIELATGHDAGAPAGIRAAQLVLTDDPAALRAPPQAAGLFHAAVLLPSRESLGQWLRHAVTHEVAFAGFSDHGVSEALYLDDPDGNGLEFYADRPREAWPLHDGSLAMGTEPLDVTSLLSLADEGEAGGRRARGVTPSPLAGATWGHMHFRVTDLDRSESFYRQELGLALMQRFGAGARFLSRDGYHHHVGLNVWGGVDEPQPEGALGLASATFAVAGVDRPRVVHDPDRLRLELVPLAAADPHSPAADPAAGRIKDST